MARQKLDMTNGPLLSKIFFFALPILFSNFLQQLFNSADSAVVGTFAGPFALSAVGSNSSIINLLVNFFSGLSLGANVIIARYIGMGEEERARKAVPTVMFVGIVCGFLMAIIGNVAARPMLLAVDTPDEIIDLATVYLKIYFSGMPFIFIYNFAAAVLRSVGDTRRPLIALAVSGVINVVLNVIFVVGFNMSVAGVGLATVISNMVSSVIVIIMLLNHKECIRLTFKGFSFNTKVFRNMFSIGMPAGLQGIVFSLSNMVIFSAINSFGAYANSGCAAAISYEHFSFFILGAFGQAAVTFMSQNYGAMKYDRCRKVFSYSMALAVAVSMALNVTVTIFRYPLLRIFTTDPEALSYGSIRVFIVVGFQSIACSYEIAGGCLRGLGRSMVPAVLSVVITCFFRVFWVYFILPLHHTFLFMLIVYPISWTLAGIAIVSAYFIVSRKMFSEEETKGLEALA